MYKFAEYSTTYARTGDDYDCEVYSMKLLARMNGNRSTESLDGDDIYGENLVDNRMNNWMNNRMNNRVKKVLDEVQDFDLATDRNTSCFVLSSQTSSETSSDSESTKSCKSTFSVSNTDDELQSIIERFSTVV